MTAQDRVKLIYQAVLGPAHLGRAGTPKAEYIANEMAKAPRRDVPLWESIGNGLCRFNLDSVHNKLRPETIHGLFVLTAKQHKGSLEQLKKQLALWETACTHPAEEVSAELELPHVQSFSVFDYLSETLPECEIKYLHFCIPVSRSSTELPTLKHYTYGLRPCSAGLPTVVSCINKGGAGKGIEIFILGKSIEHYDITFTEVTLAHRNRSRQQDHTPVVLEKKRMSDGSIGYYGEVRNFRIPEKVSSALPSAVRVKKESDLHFWFRCIPQYTDTVSIKLKIIVRPIQNPDGGIEWQC